DKLLHALRRLWRRRYARGPCPHVPSARVHTERPWRRLPNNNLIPMRWITAESSREILLERQPRVHSITPPPEHRAGRKPSARMCPNGRELTLRNWSE